MAVEGKNYVKDLTKGEMLEKGVFEKKEGNEYILSEETETAINNKVESSFQEFLNSEGSKTETDFNNWLDNDVNRILDTEKIKEIKTNNNNIEEALKSLNFTIELGNLQQTIQEQREGSATTEKISQGHYIEEQANLKNLNESITIEGLIKSQVKKEELQNLLNTIRTTNFTERDYIVDCLNSGKKEDIRKIQYLLIGKKENYTHGMGGNKEGALSVFGTDGLMGSETFNALNNYITNNKKAREQVAPAEQTNEAIVTEDQEKTQDPTASNPERVEVDGKKYDEDVGQVSVNVTATRTQAVITGNPALNPEIVTRSVPQNAEGELNIETQELSLAPGELETKLNEELKKIADNLPEIRVLSDGTKYNLYIPKSLGNGKSMQVLCDPNLKDYVKESVDGNNNECFILPANIKVGLVKGNPNILVLGEYKQKDGFLTLNTESSKFTGDPEIYPNSGDNPSLQVNSTETSGTSVSEEEEQEKKAEKESKNEYKNLENNKYGEVPAEVVDSNYDALIDYMDGKENNNLIQAFQRLEINPNSIANTLAQVLSENPEVTKFERKHISSDAMKQLGRNKKLFVNEKNNLVKILNNVERGKLQQFINEMKVFNDIRELQKTKKFVEMNKENIKKNPFLILSDFGKDGTIDTGEKGIKHHGRTSEQAMYNVFVSFADTNVWTEKRENGQSYKVIIDGPKTADLVKGFVSLMKTVGEDRYNGIESEFNGEYTMNKLGEYIVTHQETLVLYQQTINGLSYNSSMDIQDLVSDKRRKSIVDGEIQEIKEISTNRDEVNKRFESQLGKNEEFDKWFKALSTQEQKNFVGNMAVWLDEGGILPTIVKTFGIDSKTGVTVDNLDAVDIDFNFFKDDAGIGPRIALIGPLQGGLGFHLDIPIANLTANFDLNHRAVENSVIHGANPVHQLYTRLGANVGGGIVVGGKTDEKLSAYFSAAIEGALGWKADYKKGIELNARNFGNVLQNGIFKDPDFTTKENFKEKAKKSIEDILNGTDKENKNLRKFMKNNKQEMDNCVENVSNLLDVMGAFGSDKKPEHKKILLDSIMKGIVEEVKNQNLGELDGKTKLTRLGVFGQAGVGFDAKKLFQGDFKGAFGAGWSVGLEATLSAWNMVYLPDEEKYNYMDAQLKSGESIKPLGEGIKTNNIENMKNAITQSLSENSIPNIEVKSNDKNQIEISVTDAVLQKYDKKNIYELFNIYVNPEKKDNVAISEDGKTLTMGGNNLENFSVATRRYFDDFAVYLMIGGKGIDGCGNNKINDETVSQYNTAGHFEKVPGFEFTENDTTSQTGKEEIKSLGDLFESYNELDGIFTNIEKELSLMDNGNYGAYATFMNAAAELGVDKSLDTSDYDTAFDNLKDLLKGQLKDNFFEGLRSKLEDSNITDEEKVMIVDRFKAIFSYNYQLVNEHNLGLQLNGRGDKYRNLYGYDKSADFPLSPDVDYRGEIQKKLNAKGTFEREPNSNLIGMTAFYRLGDKNAGRSYMMTELGGTNVLGGETIEITNDLEATKKWFIANLEKSEAHKEILKASLREKIKSLFDFDVGTISDDDLKSLLMGENIDIGNKKIKINVKYVFYLLGECGNESIGVELGDITIKEKTNPDNPNPDNPNPDNPNPDNPNPDNPEDNVLEIGVDGQTLTKTESSNQDEVNGKFNVGNGKIEGSEDSGYGGQTNQEGTTGEGTGTGGGNTGQGGGVGGGSGSGGSNTGNGGGGRS